MSAKAQETLLSLLSAGIWNASWNGCDPDEIEWPTIEKLARKNNVYPLLAYTLDTLGIEPPPESKTRIAEMRSECFAKAMAHIAAAVRLCRNFHTHGIDVVCVKGTARAFEVYGKWDARFTHDIDLLVRDRDYRGAAKVLTSIGYDAPISEYDTWWHDYLGESPYLPVATIGPTVDLHHKLHQPGTPALTRLEPLHDKYVLRELGNFALPMLDKRDAMMLTANSFGKAIRARQPWLTYAHEIAFARANDPEMSDDVLDRHAEQAGMKRLWEHAKTSSDRVLGKGSLRENAKANYINATRPNLLADPIFLYRSRLLWHWSEGSLARPFTFLREFTWATLAEIQHDLFAGRR
ncbi:MAG: nucleotidyltransferase family protein [Pseudomonadota bacterium]